MSAFYLWIAATTAASCIVLESGIYLFEINQETFLNGAAARNLSLFMVMMNMAAIFFNFLDNKIPVKLNTSYLLNAYFSKIYPALLVLCILVLFFIFLKYGRPADYGEDRFYYWNNVAPKWANLIRLFIEQSSFFIGCIYGYKKHRYILAIFILGLVSQFLVGEKFTGMFQMLLFFMMALFIVRNIHLINIVSSFKFVFLFSSFICILLIFTLKSYFSLSGDNVLAYQSLISRIAAQSQMWWAIDNLSVDKLFNVPHVWGHFTGLDISDEMSGMNFLMSKIMPTHLYESYLDSGIALTMAFPANLTYYFGVIGAIFVCLPFAMLLSLSLWFLKFSVKNNDYIMLFLAMKLFYITIQFILMGRTYLLFEWKIILFIVPLVLAAYGNHKWRMRSYCD